MMEQSQTISGYRETVESLRPVEFDPESGSFRATYDSTHDLTSLAVVAVVAAALDKEPQAMPPLQSVIEADALDELTTESSTSPGSCDRISFTYNGFEITVTDADVIDAVPVEST